MTTSNQITSLPASIELSPSQVLKADDLARHIPCGTRIYLPDLGTAPLNVIVQASVRLRDAGLIAVPHLAARRIRDLSDLKDRVQALSRDAGVHDVLVIGGSPARPVGEFLETREILETGVLVECGIAKLGVAGHPEGSSDFDAETAREALTWKLDYARQTATEIRIVTQFGFDGAAFAAWAVTLAATGVDVPVHVGIAGPAKLTTLLKYAVACGVGNSLDFLKKRASSLTNIVRQQSPEEIVQPIEAATSRGEAGRTECLHVFPFGGLETSSTWLKDRGSFQENRVWS